MASIAILGAGDLGARVGTLLARSGLARRLLVTRRDSDGARRLANGLLVHADLAGQKIEVEGAGLDVTDVAATARLLARVRPSLILLGAVVERWWIGELLPEPRRTRFFDAHAGGWLRWR